jgi:hypothetical protein
VIPRKQEKGMLEIAGGIVLAFILIVTIDIWLPLLAYLAGFLLLLVVLFVIYIAVESSSTEPSISHQSPAPQTIPSQDLDRVTFAESAGYIDGFDAEVWLGDMSRRLERQVQDPDERIEILTLVRMEAARVDLPPELILAVIDVESEFNKDAVGADGALGFKMTLMPIRSPGDPRNSA